MKRQLNKYKNAPLGLLELWDCVQEIRCAISAEDCKRLYDSMPRKNCCYFGLLKKVDSILNIIYFVCAKLSQ